MATTLRANDGRIDLAVNQTERDAAERTLADFLQIGRTTNMVPVEVSMPPEIVGLLTRVLEAVSNGDRITVGTLPTELSTAVAADQLGVSRPTLMKWIAQGNIDSHKVGSHTRVRTEDVIAFRRARIEAQRVALDELRALDEDF